MTPTPAPHPGERDPLEVERMFATISKRYDTANFWLSQGMDAVWRGHTARAVAKDQPRRILDIATGSGALLRTLEKHNPKAEVFGVDFCLPMLELAKEHGSQRLVVGDGLRLPFAAETFDAATVAFGLRNMADWGLGLREMVRVLRPGGAGFVLDFSMPRPPLAGVYRLYLHHVLPRLAGWLTGQPDSYRYLGASIEAFPKGDAMSELMCCNGFGEARVVPLTLGVVTLYAGRKAK